MQREKEANVILEMRTTLERKGRGSKRGRQSERRGGREEEREEEGGGGGGQERMRERQGGRDTADDQVLKVNHL